MTAKKKSTGKRIAAWIGEIIEGLLLDRAATVDEAVALLKQYDMHSSLASAHHFSIADASGRSAVVEYRGEKISIKKQTVKFQPWPSS